MRFVCLRKWQMHHHLLHDFSFFFGFVYSTRYSSRPKTNNHSISLDFTWAKVLKLFSTFSLSFTDFCFEPWFSLCQHSSQFSSQKCSPFNIKPFWKVRSNNFIQKLIRYFEWQFHTKEISSIYEKIKMPQKMNCIYLLKENKVYLKLQIKMLTCYNPTLQKSSRSDKYISQL